MWSLAETSWILFFCVKYRRNDLLLVSFIELQDFVIYGTSLQIRELKFYH